MGVELLTLKDKMLIGNRGYGRVIDAVKLAAVFPVTRSMIGTADYKGAAPHRLPAFKQPAQLAIHITQSCAMALKAVMNGAIQIKVIGVMDSVDI